MDMLTVLGRQFHASQQLVRVRASRNPNEVIEKEATVGERLADSVARFGGSLVFILTFLVLSMTYVAANVFLRRSAWDPYPFILLNLFLSMLAAIQAPVIMMSQNRQDMKDRLRSELDYDVYRRAETEIQDLAHRLHRRAAAAKESGARRSAEPILAEGAVPHLGQPLGRPGLDAGGRAQRSLVRVDRHLGAAHADDLPGDVRRLVAREEGRDG